MQNPVSVTAPQQPYLRSLNMYFITDSLVVVQLYSHGRFNKNELKLK